MLSFYEKSSQSILQSLITEGHINPYNKSYILSDFFEKQIYEIVNMPGLSGQKTKAIIHEKN